MKALWKVPEIKLVGMATNATQGLQMLFTQKPDVAIVSIDLPDIATLLRGQSDYERN